VLGVGVPVRTQRLSALRAMVICSLFVIWRDAPAERRQKLDAHESFEVLTCKSFKSKEATHKIRISKPSKSEEKTSAPVLLMSAETDAPQYLEATELGAASFFGAST
jgi:hypothetical protein